MAFCRNFDIIAASPKSIYYITSLIGLYELLSTVLMSLFQYCSLSRKLSTFLMKIMALIDTLDIFLDRVFYVSRAAKCIGCRKLGYQKKLRIG